MSRAIGLILREYERYKAWKDCHMHCQPRVSMCVFFFVIYWDSTYENFVILDDSCRQLLIDWSRSHDYNISNDQIITETLTKEMV